MCISKYFLKCLSIFPLEPTFFFLQNPPFQAFLVSKTYKYIYTYKTKQQKNRASANSSGGGAKALVDASAKRFLFDVLPYLPYHSPTVFRGLAAKPPTLSPNLQARSSTRTLITPILNQEILNPTALATNPRVLGKTHTFFLIVATHQNPFLLIHVLCYQINLNLSMKHIRRN